MGPTEADLQRWAESDRLARPTRVDALRRRMADEALDAYFGVRRENTRYLTGFELGDGEEKVAGNSGQFFVGRDELVVLADSRYTVAAATQCDGARIERVYNDLFSRWQALLSSLGSIQRVGVEAGFVSYGMWQRLAAASPDVELVPVEGWVEAQRQTKEPTEIERIAAACAVADAALERLMPRIRAGATETELAIDLEWEMRTNGAEALAFEVTCLSGPNAAQPHGAPTTRALVDGEVVLFDFGAQVAGYRSDMTRTLFVGEPTPENLAIYELVARAQQTAIDELVRTLSNGSLPSGKVLDTISREVIREAGHGDHYGHGLGHGIGLATHELPSLGVSAPDVPLPSPTVFSVEPGTYIEGVTGVRIEDLVLFDAAANKVELLTRFPREVTVVG